MMALEVSVEQIAGRGVVERQLWELRGMVEALQQAEVAQKGRLKRAGAPSYSVPLVKAQAKAKAYDRVLAILDKRLAQEVENHHPTAEAQPFLPL